jgi:hypothetical protein
MPATWRNPRLLEGRVILADKPDCYSVQPRVLYGHSKQGVLIVVIPGRKCVLAHHDLGGFVFRLCREPRDSLCNLFPLFGGCLLQAGSCLGFVVLCGIFGGWGEWIQGVSEEEFIAG